MHSWCNRRIRIPPSLKRRFRDSPKTALPQRGECIDREHLFLAQDRAAALRRV
jgi:hypothetical protein